MSLRIRSTENLDHPVWQRLKSVFKIGDIQGLLLKATDEELIHCTRAPCEPIDMVCLEAVEYDQRTEFCTTKIFSEKEWLKKIAIARFFNAPLYLLSYGSNDRYLFRLHSVSCDASYKPMLREVRKFPDEAAFITWWATVKTLSQTKFTVEAKPRQRLTHFDRVIEKHGFQWGGNIDGFIMASHPPYVRAIIEVRQTRRRTVTDYDPARYFSGTAKKGGDFKTWLPLVYLKKTFDLPLVLITLSAKERRAFGFAEVVSLNYKKLFYADERPPTQNITEHIKVFQKWMQTITNQNEEKKQHGV